MTTATWLLLAVVCVTGAGIQSSAGLGLGLLLSPALSFVAPDLLPGVPLMLYAASGALMTARDWRHVDRRVVAWAAAGLVPGLAAGVLARGALPHQLQPVVLGVGVLLIVTLSLVCRAPRRPTWVAVAGGFGASGLGAVCGVVSPPMSLATHGLGSDASRATTAVVTCAASIGGLAVLVPAGEVSSGSWSVAALLLPVMLAGLVVGRRLKGRLAGPRFRPAVHTLVAVTGLSVLAHGLVLAA